MTESFSLWNYNIKSIFFFHCTGIG